MAQVKKIWMSHSFWKIGLATLYQPYHQYKYTIKKSLKHQHNHVTGNDCGTLSKVSEHTVWLFHALTEQPSIFLGQELFPPPGATLTYQYPWISVGHMPTEDEPNGLSPPGPTSLPGYKGGVMETAQRCSSWTASEAALSFLCRGDGGSYQVEGKIWGTTLNYFLHMKKGKEYQLPRLRTEVSGEFPEHTANLLLIPRIKVSMVSDPS